MTIGEGILWSTILVIIFVSILLLTKHQRWRAFLKGLGVVLGFVVLAGVGWWGYVQYGDRPKLATSLQDISLGMTQVEVTLVKGKPDRVLTDEDSETLIYDRGESDSDAVFLRGKTPEELVVRDVCSTSSYGSVQGIGRFSSENKLIEKLGEPSSVSINRDGTEKIVTYPEWNAAYGIKRGEVSRYCITSRPAMKFKAEYSDRETKVSD